MISVCILNSSDGSGQIVLLVFTLLYFAYLYICDVDLVLIFWLAIDVF